MGGAAGEVGLMLKGDRRMVFVTAWATSTLVLPVISVGSDLVVGNLFAIN